MTPDIFDTTRLNVVCQEALIFYGKDRQLVKCVEEMSELAVELCHMYQGVPVPMARLYGEVAVVYILLHQIKMIYGNEALLEQLKAEKIIAIENKILAEAEYKARGGE